MNGINFKQPLFHAVVEGRKTMTRRVMKPQPDAIRSITRQIASHPGYEISEKVWTPAPAYHFLMSENRFIKPRYKVGETLYLKEPYFADGDYVIYRFDNEFKKPERLAWENKLFMPERYARYFIEITGVKAERLQDISDEDCLKEGIIAHYGGFEDCTDEELVYYSNGIETDFETPQQAFAALIDKINGRGTWDSNPYVWAYEFKLVK